MTRKGYTAVRLTDRERKDTSPTGAKAYHYHIAWINHAEFAPGPALEAERERLHREQLEKNLEWEKKKKFSAIVSENKNDPTFQAAVVTNLQDAHKPVAIQVDRPDLGRSMPVLPKYSKTCDLLLDPGTGNTVLLVASSKAGKTTLQMHLYEKYFKKSIAVMFAHSTQLKIYKKKNLIVTDNFNPDIIELMRRLNKISKNKFPFTCMFDDMLQLKNSDTVQDLFLSLRNSNISSLISLQYVNLLSKACRGNVNTILGGAMNSDENILVFIKCYLQTYMRSVGMRTDPDMIAWYRELTKNHGFVNIHPASGTISFCRLSL